MQETEGQKNYINWTGPGQVVFTEADTSGLISILSNTLGGTVVDKTGLKGFYNFKLDFADPRCPRGRAKDGGQGPDGSLPDISTAVQGNSA